MPAFPIHESEVLQRQATHLIGTLGHVSEGKSTFIRSLTGIKTQRHQREQERNITIHLGYANCKVYQNLHTGDLQAQRISDEPPAESQLIAHLSFVDCPGHEAFLATMLGGASIMDTAALIIAANQEQIPQPQTLEHLIAAHLMGLERFVVLQNKLDLLTTEQAQENFTKIKGFLKDSNAEKAPLFPISAQHGWNVHHVLDSLMSLTPPPRRLQAAAQLTCVRSFDVNKPQAWVPSGPKKSALQGAVLGGTLSQGVLVPGDWLEIRPGQLLQGPNGDIICQPLFTRVKELRCEDQVLPYAVPGSLIAIQTTLDPSYSIANHLVGQRVGEPGTLPPVVGDITIKFKTLKRASNPFQKARKNDRVRVCANVMTVEGTILDIPEKKIRVIRLDKPLCLGRGETVSLLRRNEEAGRELLEGCGVVQDFELWPDMRELPGPSQEDLKPQAERNPEWIPIEKQAFAPQTLSYTDLLEELEEKKENLTGGKKLKLKEPELQRIPKHVVIKNWSEMWGPMDNKIGMIPAAQHLQEYIEKELSTSSSVNGAGQLILGGNWKVNAICSVLRKYVSAYKTCRQCKGTNTGLVKDGRALKIRCGFCLAESYVDKQ